MKITDGVKVLEHWVVDVEDERDVEKNLPGYHARFIFEGESAARDAWLCFARAQKAGFKASAEKVRRVS